MVMGAEGTEHLSKPPEKPHVGDQGGAKSGAVDPELIQVTRLWHRLPANVSAERTAEHPTCPRQRCAFYIGQRSSRRVSVFGRNVMSLPFHSIANIANFATGISR